MFSDRRHSKIYYNSDKTQHLKVITDAAHCPAEEEFEKATLVYNAGIETPKPLELVSCNGEKAIIFEYIKDKKSYHRLRTSKSNLLFPRYIE